MNLKALNFATIVLAATHFIACDSTDSNGSGTGGQGGATTGASGSQSTSTTAATSSVTGGATGASTTAATGGKSSDSTTTASSSVGGDSVGGGSGGACKSEKDVARAITPPSEACKEFCKLEDACDSTTTIDQCIEYRKCAQYDLQGATDKCPAAAQAYWDCMRAQTDLCKAADCCVEQDAAVTAACAEQ